MGVVGAILRCQDKLCFVRLLCCCALLCLVSKAEAKTRPAAQPVVCADAPECRQLAEQAQEKSRSGDYDAAERLYEQAYAKKNDPMLLYNRARMLHKASRYHEAVSLYRQYLEVELPDNQTQRRTANAFLLEADQNTCEGTPECRVLDEQAHEKSQVGRVDEAQRLYKQAYEIKSDPMLLYNRARVLHKAGRFEEAVAVYQQYLDVGADHSETQRRKTAEYLTEARAEIKPTPPPQVVILDSTKGSKKPISRTWWLWTAVGGTALGIALGVGLGVASRRPDVSNAFVIMLNN